MDDIGIGSRIRKLRKSRNLTQDEFGKIFGVVKSTVSAYENGKSTPDDSIKIAVCRYFNVSTDYLFGLEKREFCHADQLSLGDLEISDYIDELKKRPELRNLFAVTKDAGKKDIEKIIAVMEIIRKD